MSILITPDTKILIQGITGEFGARHTRLSLDYGTKVVAGVTPGKGGQTGIGNRRSLLVGRWRRGCLEMAQGARCAARQ